MKEDLARSDRILEEAGRTLAIQRAGGTHRPARSIGKGSARIKRRTWKRRATYLVSAIGAIFLAVIAAGLVLDGIGFTGIMLAFLAGIAALVIFTNFPRVEVPRRADLKKGDPRSMIARTELWLEAQRPALPPPAAQLVDRLGAQLDGLGTQLEAVDPSHPAVGEIRALVGEYLPETIESYCKIPQALRARPHAGQSADARLEQALGQISREIERATEQLAQGALDTLAIRTRFLEYQYGENADIESEKS